MRIDISDNNYKKLWGKRFFFLRFHEDDYHEYNESSRDYSTWKSVDSDLGISFLAGNFGNRFLGYCLCIIEKVFPKKDEHGDKVENMLVMYFHEVDENNVDDWNAIFSDYVSRSKDIEDKFVFLYLLWMLDKKSWSVQTLENCLSQYKQQSLPFFINILCKICKCLSHRKQTAIEELCKILGGTYKTYMPPIIIQMHNTLYNKKTEDSNLFELVDNIFKSDYEREKEKIIPLINDNPLAAVLHWLNTEEGLSDYSILRSVFSMLNEQLRLEIVKRYFHDIRLGHTQIDINLLGQFKDNDYEDFIIYRYCIETPAEPVNLTIPLLCDNIITLYNSKGKAFQTLDGILDIAMTHCDITQPAIRFHMEKFLPVCNGGAVYNQNFKGFIDYTTIRKIDESKLTDENLEKTIKNLLDYFGRRQTYAYCKFDEQTILNKECIKNCSKYECLGYRPYDTKWTINIKNVSVLSCFLKEPINVHKNEDIAIDEDMLSVDVLRKYILNLSTKFPSNGDGEFVVSSYRRNPQNYDLTLIEEYSLILRMRIIPRSEIIVGQKYDVFGYWSKIEEKYGKRSNQMLDVEKKQALNEFETLEGEEVKKRTIASLKNEIGVDINNQGYFEMAFDRDILEKIIQKYYHKSSFSNKEFLTHSSISTGYKSFCAPEYSDKHNPSIDLPYFWCRGNECFKNALDNQTIEIQHNWHEYSLYHMIEIIGYPKLHKTEAGYEPDKAVWQFIAIANKVARKFKSLKCRSCGHLLFSAGRITGYNRNNYYGCINPACNENRKLVYLNYCYSCKKGLIDSRDSKQCSNGWYICPTCASCCDDAQYDRMSQRYVVLDRPVPERITAMKGHGHNDKGIYFCHKCGSQLKDDVNELVCTQCDTKYIKR